MPSANVEIIRKLYGAFGSGDIPTAVALMAPDITWNEAESFPYADNNPYVGADAILAGVFGRIMADWDGWRVDMEALHDAGDTVIMRGRYVATCKATGTPISAQCAHVWGLKDGKVASFGQYVDTLQVVEAMKG